MAPIRLKPILIRATSARACLVVALDSAAERAPMAWATMVKAPVDTEIITTPTTMVMIWETPTAEMASAPRWPTR